MRIHSSIFSSTQKEVQNKLVALTKYNDFDNLVIAYDSHMESERWANYIHKILVNFFKEIRIFTKEIPLPPVNFYSRVLKKRDNKDNLLVYITVNSKDYWDLKLFKNGVPYTTKDEILIKDEKGDTNFGVEGFTFYCDSDKAISHYLKTLNSIWQNGLLFKKNKLMNRRIRDKNKIIITSYNNTFKSMITGLKNNGFSTLNNIKYENPYNFFKGMEDLIYKNTFNDNDIKRIMDKSKNISVFISNSDGTKTWFITKKGVIDTFNLLDESHYKYFSGKTTKSSKKFNMFLVSQKGISYDNLYQNLKNERIIYDESHWNRYSNITNTGDSFQFIVDVLAQRLHYHRKEDIMSWVDTIIIDNKSLLNNFRVIYSVHNDGSLYTISEESYNIFLYRNTDRSWVVNIIYKTRLSQENKTVIFTYLLNNFFRKTNKKKVVTTKNKKTK